MSKNPRRNGVKMTSKDIAEYAGCSEAPAIAAPEKSPQVLELEQKLIAQDKDVQDLRARLQHAAQVVNQQRELAQQRVPWAAVTILVFLAFVLGSGLTALAMAAAR